MALAHAILAFLVEHPCSGYDLSKQFGGSVGYFWNASYQQIYRELTKLEAQGWVEAEEIPQEGRPDKKLYSVTRQGQEQLAVWIAKPGEPTPTKDDLLVKLFAGYVVQPQTILAELDHHRHLHEEKLAAYRDLEQCYFQNPQALPLPAQYRYLTLLNGIHYETGWLRWCDQAIHLLQEQLNQET
jgi:DNA-binding PadR family transcriptional regulator